MPAFAREQDAKTSRQRASPTRRKVIGTSTVAATGRPAAVAGVKRQRRTASSAASSRLSWPLLRATVTLSGVQGAYNVVVVSGGVTIARLRAE